MSTQTAYIRNNKIYNYNFDNKSISTDGAMVLTKKIVQNSEILKSFSKLIPDSRNPFMINYTKEDLVNQRVLMMMQGYEDCNDAEKLNHDPLIELVLGNTIASQSTLSRLENAIDKRTIYFLCLWYLNNYIDTLNSSMKEIIIDVDGSCDPTHGQQQLSAFNTFYDTNMYMEIFFKDGKTGQLIMPLLLPGYYNSSRLFTAILKRIIKKIKEKIPSINIIVRADAAYSKPDFYNYTDKEKNVYFAIGIASNAVLKREVKEQEAFIIKNILPLKKDFEMVSLPIDYKAVTWESAQKVYARFQVINGVLETRFFASNMGQTIYDGNQLYWDFYTQRGEASENRIKEIKKMCFSDRLSCHNFWANFFRMHLYCMSYEIFRMIKVLISQSGVKEAMRWNVNSIRLNLLKVGAWVKESKRRITIYFSSSFKYKILLEKLINLA